MLQLELRVPDGMLHRQVDDRIFIARQHTADLLVELFLRDSVYARWGAMAEIGCSAPITPDERKVNRAAGRMQALANLPIISHTPNGAMAVEQLDLFESAGAKAPHILIGHLGAQTMVPIDVFKTIAKRGALVTYQQIRPLAGLEKWLLRLSLSVNFRSRRLLLLKF